MNYEFPVIEHIDQILPIIKDKKEFFVSEKDQYKVINYAVNFADTFEANLNPSIEDTILRECRGIIFDKDGYILSRPFQKFFNLGEKEETKIHNIDIKRNHKIYEKMDGSMIRPIYLKEYNGFRLGTKMGITDVAMEAEVFVAENPYYFDFFRYCLANDLTPIYEWISPNNRIVIKYDKSDLVLLAVRNTKTGVYYDLDDLDYKLFFHLKGMNSVNFYGKINDIESFLQKARALKDIEEYVIRFDSGHMVKIKSDEYVLLHKSKDIVSNERNVVELILDEKVDDILPLLVFEEDKQKVIFLNEKVNKSLLEFTNELKFYFEKYKNMSRKEFALTVDLHPIFKKGIFFLMDNGDALSYMRHCFKRNINTLTLYGKFKEEFNLKW